MIRPHFLRIASLLVLALAITACSKPKQPPLPIGNLAIGVAQVTQPSTAGEMLAGYMPEDIKRIPEKALRDMDSAYSEILFKESKHKYVSSDVAQQCYRTVAKTADVAHQSALRTWSAVGRCMKVDLLVVPHVLHWQERDGGGAGVVAPASVIMDTFILDVNNETLVSRSHYDETQTPLASNLLNAGKFFKRGARWVTAQELVKEGVQKAVKELGL